MYTGQRQSYLPSDLVTDMSSIIILVHNVKTRNEILDQTDRCLVTLASTISTPHNELILVDNGSQDDGKALDLLKSKKDLFPVSVVVRSEENRNISTWWNDCLGLATHDEIILLNNDIVFNKAAWYSELLYPLGSNQTAASGSRMLGWNGVSFLEGAFLAFRKSVVLPILGDRPFDEQFEFTCEDMDFCYRLTKAGRNILATGIEEKGYVTHLGHGTLSWSNEEGGWNGQSILNVMHQGRLKFCRKHGLPERVND